MFLFIPIKPKARARQPLTAVRSIVIAATQAAVSRKMGRSLLHVAKKMLNAALVLNHAASMRTVIPRTQETGNQKLQQKDAAN